MVISVYGFSDKRPIIYSCLKLLGSLGRTLFVTNNPQYIQLSENFERDFSIDDISILIPTESINDIDENFEDYDYVLLDLIAEVVENQDIAIIIDHVDNYKTWLEEFEKPPIYYIQKGNKLDKTDKVAKFIYASSVESTLSRIEKDKLFYPISNGTHNKTLASILNEITGIKTAELLKYLKKKVGIKK